MNRSRMHGRLGMVPVKVGLALVAIAGAGLAHARDAQAVSNRSPRVERRD